MTVQPRGQRTRRTIETTGERPWKVVMPSVSGAMQIASKAQDERYAKMFGSVTGGVAERLFKAQDERYAKMFGSVTGGVAERLFKAQDERYAKMFGSVTGGVAERLFKAQDERYAKMLDSVTSGFMVSMSKAQDERYAKMLDSVTSGFMVSMSKAQDERTRKMLDSVTSGFMVSMSGGAQAGSHYRARSITAQSVLLSDRYRGLTRTAIFELTGSLAPDDAINSFLDGAQDIDLPNDAWSSINDVAPEVAAAIEEQAATLGIAWLDRETARDALATLIWGLYLFAWFVGLPTLLAPGPQTALLGTLLLPEVRPPSVIDRVDRKLDKYWPDTTPPEGAR